MSEGAPVNLPRTNREPTEPQRIITPALIALGRIYGVKPIPIPIEWAEQTRRLTRELFDSVKYSSTENINIRDKKITEILSGINGGTRPTLEALGKQFRITRERVRQIEAKSGRILRGKIARTPEFKELPNLLPFNKRQIGHDLFGEDITRREIKDKLPEGIRLQDLNLTDPVLISLETNDSLESGLFEFLLLSPHLEFLLRRPQIMKELAEAFEKIGIKTKPQNN